MLMVDWLSCEVPDSVGLPVHDGHVCRVSPDGSIEWSSACRKQLRGSHDSSMTFRAVGAEYVEAKRNFRMPGHHSVKRKRSGLQVSGNPAKFLQGHNLFGSDCPTDVLTRVMERAAPQIWPDLAEVPALDLADADISRIDLTGAWQLDRPEDVPIYLRAMESSVWVPIRGRGVFDKTGNTLYYGMAADGERAKDWALKLYWKGPEITKHRLPDAAYQVPGLLEDVNRWLRVELTLRTGELKRLGLRKVGDWTPEIVKQIWESYVSKLDFGEATVNLDTADLGALGLKPRHVHALAAWRAGNDMRSGVSESTFYRLRKEIKAATGYDILTKCQKSNVVQLRRVVTASPVLQPHWADHLTAALCRAA